MKKRTVRYRVENGKAIVRLNAKLTLSAKSLGELTALVARILKGDCK